MAQPGTEAANDIAKQRENDSAIRAANANTTHVQGYGNPSPRNTVSSLTDPNQWAQQFVPHLSSPSSTQQSSGDGTAASSRMSPFTTTSRVLPDSVGRALFDNTPNPGATAAANPGQFTMTPYGPIRRDIDVAGQQFSPPHIANNGVAHTPIQPSSGAASEFPANPTPIAQQPVNTPPPAPISTPAPSPTFLHPNSLSEAAYSTRTPAVQNGQVQIQPKPLTPVRNRATDRLLRPY